MSFAVSSGGLVEMLDDEPIEVLTELAVPECPTLELTPNLDALEEPEEEEEPPPAKAEPDRTEFIRRIVERATDVPRDREVTEAIVAMLLEDAIRKRETNTLLRHFNSETAADRPIERLTQVVSRSVPMIVIESDIPFVEDFVAGLIDGPNGR